MSKIEIDLKDSFDILEDGLVPSRETSLTITDLESTYNRLLQRQISRVKEGKLNTYKK